MLQLDEQEKMIVRELIRDPRSSDNHIGKTAKIPIKTVNRKRKLLEEQGLLSYYTSLNHADSGTATLSARKMYIIELQYGITNDAFMQKVHMLLDKPLSRKHIHASFLAESRGHLALVLMLEAQEQLELLEILNGQIVPELKLHLGEHCIKNIEMLPLMADISNFHNYSNESTEQGKLKKDIADDSIFVI
jgi:DNA-binding Lrp family transcriptional regulator